MMLEGVEGSEKVRIWLPLPLPFTDLLRIWLVNAVDYKTHPIGQSSRVNAADWSIE